MTPQYFLSGVLAIGSLCSLGFVAVSWAHHPMPRPGTISGSPWSLMWFLAVGVFAVAFVVTLAVFSILERRQRAGSDTRKSVRRP
jgi:hypothetical protein